MRTLLCSLLGTAVLIAGCTKESEPGGPGAQGTGSKTVERSYKSPEGTVVERDRMIERDTTVNKGNTFTLTVPATETDLERGERKEVKIAIDRGDQFSQAVQLQFKAPAGLQVIPPDTVIKAGEEETTVMLEASETAPLGEVSIELIGIPGSGKSVATTMKVEVKERD